MTTVAEMTITALADFGATHAWGVVGDALNPLTEAIRQQDRMEWVGVRHEEVGAFAAGARAQLTGQLGLCMGTVGPGSIHLLDGLYEGKRSRAQVVAGCGRVRSSGEGRSCVGEVYRDVVVGDGDVRHRLA